MRYSVLVLVVAAACHKPEARRTAPSPAARSGSAVAADEPELICSSNKPSGLRDTDPTAGGYRMLADDTARDHVIDAMKAGKLLGGGQDRAASRALESAIFDLRTDIEHCMHDADGPAPDTQYELRITLSGNSVASLAGPISLRRLAGVNADHSPELVSTAAEPCVQKLLGHLELPPGGIRSQLVLMLRADFCTPRLVAALQTASAFADAYRRWSYDHRGQRCPASLTELAPYTGSTNLDDPWHQPYVMRCDARAFEVVSGGPDRKLGTADDLSSKQ